MIHVGRGNARTFYAKPPIYARAVSSRRFHLFTSVRRREDDLAHASPYRAHCSLYSDWQSRALPTLNSVRWHGAKSSRSFITARFTSCASARTFRVGGHPDSNNVEKTWQRKCISFCASCLYDSNIPMLMRSAFHSNLEINIFAASNFFTFLKLKAENNELKSIADCCKVLSLK